MDISQCATFMCYIPSSILLFLYNMNVLCVTYLLHYLLKMKHLFLEASNRNGKESNPRLPCISPRQHIAPRRLTLYFSTENFGGTWETSFLSEAKHTRISEC